MIYNNLFDLRETWSNPPTTSTLEGDCDSGIEDEFKSEGVDSTIFLAFKGDIDDKDFPQKLEKILEYVPNLISMESNQLKVHKVEPWNSVRVTFSIPREAAERLRLLAQGNNQQLRDLGILSVQIEGEGAINLSLPQNRVQEVRMNGPMAANSTVRLDGNFPLQGGAGLIRMNNPTAAMMSQGTHASSSAMSTSSSTDLQTRTPRPPSQQDAMEAMVSGLAGQQQNHPTSSMTPQLHPMQTMAANRPMNPANFQQFQQQSRLPQHQQVSQGLRPSFSSPAQVPVPPGWNQLTSGVLQPPPASAGIGAVASNQGWKKSPVSGSMHQQQFAQRPSLATVQTPSHPPPPYPFGSQQASQAHANFPSITNPNQFSASPMKPLQGSPARVPTPLQQSHLTSKSPASSPSSSFQQGSPASSPTVSQVQQALGARAGQGNSLPQGFQQQPVSSPNRGSLISHVNAGGNFMMQQVQQQSQGPQGMHAGVSKRLPPNFASGQANANFMQGQTPPSATGSPANGGAQQQLGNGNGQGTGGQTNGSSHNQMQASHGGPSLMQTNLMGLHSNLNNQLAGGSGMNQINMVGLHGQPQQGPQSQLLGMHQQIISSQGQMVNIQGQAPLNTHSQLVLSRSQLMPQTQMMGAAQNQNLGQAPQRMTSPKQMIAQHNQMMASQGQAMMHQNTVMEQIMQGSKQGFNTQNQSGNMAGPSQIIRGPNQSVQGSMVQFSGQAVAQQGVVNSNSSPGLSLQGQVLRSTGPSPHLQQTHGDNVTQGGTDLGAMLPDLSMQQTGNIASQHLQNMPGSGQHFGGHGLSFSSPFAQGGNGGQMTCGQNSAFPVNKDVTLTSPLLVNLLQSDISAGHFGVNNKQNTTAIKPKKKKPPRKKKVQQGDEQMSEPHFHLLHSTTTDPRMEESDHPGIPGEQGPIEPGQKLSKFNSRPPGYPSQSVEQRSLQQIPPQLMQLGQQQGQSGQQLPPQQQMMMMLMMQQDQKPVRLPVQQSLFNPRASLNSDTQRMPVQQGGNMSVLVNLQGSGSIPPSPDKQRMPMSASTTIGNNGRKVGFQDSGQNPSGSPLGDLSSTTPLSDVPDLPVPHGSQSNITPHLLISQNQLMMSGTKPGTPSSMSLPQGASPQTQHTGTMPGPHGHHFQSVPPQSQTSRPKTPNRASPRPYYPQTPNNRPPSTEPSEISLSPERLNASIAGLFPPQINIPLPPRPTLNRGFDQQGLNPTTLKAIGQAPASLTVNNPSGFVPSHMNRMDNGGGKQPNAGGNKRASPSNSRRSSPASSRKATPSPGRQNAKAAKFVLGPQQTSGLLHNIEMARNSLLGQAPLQTTTGAVSGLFPSASMPVTSSTVDEIKETPAPDNESLHSQIFQKELPTPELRSVVQQQEIKITQFEETDSVELSRVIEENKNVISPAMRDAPTSLSQLLDHSSAPNVTIKPCGPSHDSSPLLPIEETKKSVPPLLDTPSKEASSTLNTVSNIEQCSPQTLQEMAEHNTNVPLNLPAATLKRPVGSTSMSAPLPPNQITVFVTSNPMTTSANVSAPMSSHLPPALVSTVVTMPNVGSKVIVSEGQQTVQTSARPQFITPVFINSSSLIQVMKGSQQSNLPASTMAPNASLMPQSVAVVGPLHISPNIQFSSGPPSSTASSSAVSTLPPTRPVVINTMQTTNQFAQSSSPSALPQTPSNTQSKDTTSEDTSYLPGTMPDQHTALSLQPIGSPSFDSSPDPSTGNKRSSAVSSKVQCKVDKIGQLLLTKAKKVTSPPDKSVEEQLSTEIESSNTTEAVDSNRIDRTSPLNQIITEASSSVIISSSNLLCPTISTTVNVLPTVSYSQSTTTGGQGIQSGTISEQTGMSLEESFKEHSPPTVSSQSTSQEEGSVSEEVVPETTESDPPENTEIETTERSRPPSRRNSKAEDSIASQEVGDSGQRKRSARPSSASSSACSSMKDESSMAAGQDIRRY
ncbi:nuclear receptor coactivator 6 isoform X2 [Bombina bombina]|uniref:nuclear receptor coactivator 6 isoform X2 n=1 Tax=Bombina bombina TaxID=8345 RepID=UPI00235AD430|nr:nuclear receptor coactivator 6 isoform X2 [Bombina bombina]